MGEVSEPVSDNVNLPQTSAEDDDLKIDAIADAIAPSLAFNEVSFPPDLPDHIKIMLERRIDELRQTAEEAGFARKAGERLTDGKTRDERKRDRSEQELTDAVELIEESARQQREEASFDAWRQTSHTYAGQTMGGEDWNRLMKWFSDADNVSAWEDAMMAATGQTRDEVRQTGGRMKRFYDLMEKDARGTMTDEERAEFEKLNDDPEIKRGVTVQQQIQSFNIGMGHHQTAQSEAAFDGTTNDRIAARNSLSEDVAAPSGALAQVPSLTPIYADAAIGRPSSPQPIVPSSPGLAANTVQVSPDNMFG